MKYPKNLSKLGAIGLAAPSFGCNIEPYKSRLDNAVQRLKEWGHPVMLGPNCYLGEGIGISNKPELCGRELTDVYCSRDNDVVLSCGGGELMNETIDCVDWDRIRQAPPKWFAGYSDNTNFTFLLTTLLDTASLYAPNAPSFGMEPLHPALNDLYGVLRGEIREVSNYDGYERIDEGLDSPENPLAPINVQHPFAPAFYDGSGKVTGSVSMSGRLIGGCLDVLSNLRGTKYDRVPDFCEKYKEDGFIWFLESCELGPMAVRRTLWSMKQSGWFRHVKGFLIGRPMFDDKVEFGQSQADAVIGAVREFGVPVAFGLDFGHLPPAMPIVCGACCDVRGEGNSFVIKYRFE